MSGTIRQPKYKVGDRVSHKLGFPVIITKICTIKVDGFTEKTFKWGWPWKRYEKTIHIKTGLVDVFEGGYNGRSWAQNQSPMNKYFVEEEFENNE